MRRRAGEARSGAEDARVGSQTWRQSQRPWRYLERSDPAALRAGAAPGQGSAEARPAMSGEATTGVYSRCGTRSRPATTHEAAATWLRPTGAPAFHLAAVLADRSPHRSAVVSGTRRPISTSVCSGIGYPQTDLHIGPQWCRVPPTDLHIGPQWCRVLADRLENRRRAAQAPGRRTCHEQMNHADSRGIRSPGGPNGPRDLRQ